MKFKNKYSDKAMFTFKNKRYRCRKGLIDTSEYKEESKELDKFLEKNPSFEKVEEESTKKSGKNSGSGKDSGDKE